MASIKEIRTRIVSVNSTKKITSAMKMVSAAKLRKAQTAVSQMKPYAAKLDELLANLSSGIDPEKGSIYVRQTEVKKVLIVAIASNSGLCGAFNGNVVKQAIALSESKYGQQLNAGGVQFMAIGKKVADLFKSKGVSTDFTDIELFDSPSLASITAKAQGLMDAFANSEFDKIELVYNRFINAATQIVTSKEFLPLTVPEGSKASSVDYIFEPSKEFVVQEIIPKSLKLKFYNAVLESLASEHGARMTSMHKATDNATSLIKQLKLDYNKARQAAITNEILEIVGGANALKG
jgi:F-type H+-transporting ATPase subunit gamma